MDPLDLARESEQIGETLVARGERLLKLGRELLQQADQLYKTDVPQAPLETEGEKGIVNLDLTRLKARELKNFTRLEWEATLGLPSTTASMWLNNLLKEKTVIRETDPEGHIGYRYIRSLADEDPLFITRVWVTQQQGSFELEEAVRGTGLPEPEVVNAITDLVVEGVVAGEPVAKDDEEVNGVDKVEITLYRYVPPLPDGVQSDLERKRLANVLDVPSVRRGEPVRIRTERRQGRARSTPGSRQKLINQDRNWERLQQAAQERVARDQERTAREKARPKSKRGRK